MPVSPQTQEQIQKIYRRPRLYERIYAHALHPGRQAAIAALPLKRPLRVLEVGIGSGLSLPFYPEGVDIVGIDPSAEMIRHAAANARNLGEHILLQQMDGAKLSFADRSFDAAVFLFVLSVAPDPSALLREAQRALKPGGIAIIANYFHWELPLLRHLTFLTKNLGFHTHLRLRHVTSSPGWRVQRNDRVRLGRIVVLEKIECQ